MCARKARHQDRHQRAQTAAAPAQATTTVAARLREIPHQAEATTAAARPQEAHRQVRAATIAEAAVQAQAAIPVQAVTVQAAVVAQVAAVAVAAQAAEEDKKNRPQSNKKTTFAASLQGSFFMP